MAREKQLAHYAFGDNDQMPYYLLSDGQRNTYSMNLSVLGFAENNCGIPFYILQKCKIISTSNFFIYTQNCFT